MKTTIGDFLLSRLSELDIAHLLGVPGDFNLQFLDQIQRTPNLDFIGCRNELNAAYAADGYARLNGVSALLTTYGVGDLSAICGVAGAAAEHVPLICVSGAPPLHIMQKGLPLHHTLGDGNYADVMNCFSQFCTACTRLTPANAAAEIDRVLTACCRDNKPVYIQLPSDISHVAIDVPDARLELDRNSTAEQLESALAEMMRLWRSSRRPAILADMDADRFGYEKLLLEFAETTATPYATLMTGKAILPELHPLSLGMYQGAYSAAECRNTIEGSDFLLAAAPRFIEANSGHFTARLPDERVVMLLNDAVSINGETYYAVDSRELLTRFLVAVRRQTKASPVQCTRTPRSEPLSIRDHAPLTQARLWPRLARFIAANDVVIAEAGTSSIGLGGEPLPSGITYINSNIWGAIGFTLPALLGSCLAAPQRRHLLFIGDGSFQVTAQELSTLLNQGQQPVVFIVNNRGYTIERYIRGMHASYNDVDNWDYGALASAFDDSEQYISLDVRDETQLEQALTTIGTTDKLALVQLHLDPMDAPDALKKFGPATADFDYGRSDDNDTLSRTPDEAFSETRV